MPPPSSGKGPRAKQGLEEEPGIIYWRSQAIKDVIHERPSVSGSSVP